MNWTAIAAIIAALGVAGLAVVGVLVYTKRITWEQAAKTAGLILTPLAILGVGVAAGRRKGGSEAFVPPAPPEGKTADLAKELVVESTTEAVEVIESAEADPDELERLRRLTDT